jgi:hypothetical protein
LLPPRAPYAVRFLRSARFAYWRKGIMLACGQKTHFRQPGFACGVGRTIHHFLWQSCQVLSVLDGQPERVKSLSDVL